MVKMKASKMLKYAFVITYGICLGKMLGDFTQGLIVGIAEDALSKYESKSE
jgi:vacuolar-type H+-ATPase subunit I/STV1